MKATLQRPCMYHAQLPAMAHHHLGSSPSAKDLASGPHWDPVFSYCLQGPSTEKIKLLP